ncbi:MAG: nitronate monooxygenase [Burkholderiaceae bacterium]|nr:nitronate monooxygenase [Burkholderiales bacterium]MCZ8337949.1 nitronate monooxygenase [Burkholderiaceae bacterium]
METTRATADAPPAARPVPLETPVCAMFGLAHPVFAFSHSVPVAAAVSRCGGLGTYGATRRTPQEIRDELAQLRELAGDAPIGVNLVLPPGMPEDDDPGAIERELPERHKAFVRGLYDKYRVPPPKRRGMRTRFLRSNEVARAQMDAVVESDVELVACGIGAPADFVERCKRRGKRIVALCGSPKHARRALDAGADLLVAQGHDSAAHTGPIGTFSLVPQVVEVAGRVPVLAAGGVMTGRHVAAGLALGAQGAWTGSLWLASEEYAIHPILLRKLIAAGSDDTVVTRSESGKTFRQLRSAWSDEWAAPEAPRPLAMPYQDVLVGDLLGAIDDHEIEPLMHYAVGQGVAWIRERRTVAELYAALVEETWAALDALRTIGGRAR